MSLEVSKIISQFKNECDWMSVRYVKEQTQRRSMREALPETNSTDLQEGIMFEVVKNGHLAFAGTSDLSPAGLKACFQRGLDLAESSGPYKVMEFQPRLRGQKSGKYKSSKDKSLAQGSLKELVDVQSHIAKKLKSTPNAISSSVNFWLIQHQTHYATSDAVDIQQDIEMVTQSLSVTAQKGEEIQTRSDGGLFALSSQRGLEVFEKDLLLARTEQIASEVNELIVAEECPAGKFDLLLTPSQMMLQIHESIGHPLELDRILGDERNYAGWSFVKPEDFGKLQYGSPLMNVVFDPKLQNEFASYAFDDAGVEAERVFLIKEGRLLAGLGSSESQMRSKLPGVSNWRAESWNRAPIDRMANINLEPGTSSLKDMISSIERGVLMDSNRSWSIDDYRNKFQFGCEYAKWIEDGKIKKVVKNPNYRGITVPFWNSLKMVGDRSTYEILGTPFCGKGEPNQVIRVGHASPAALFSQVEVFGGLS